MEVIVILVVALPPISVVILIMFLILSGFPFLLC